MRSCPKWPPLTAKRSRSLWEIKAALDFSPFPSCAVEPGSGAELWEAKHGIVERYGSATSGDTDCGRSNICFGRGKGRKSAPRSRCGGHRRTDSSSLVSWSVRLFAIMSWLNCVSPHPGSYVFLGVLGGFGDGGASKSNAGPRIVPLRKFPVPPEALLGELDATGI